MHDASWPVGGSRGVCNEEVILTVHWHWFKLSWLSFHRLSMKARSKSIYVNSCHSFIHLDVRRQKSQTKLLDEQCQAYFQASHTSTHHLEYKMWPFHTVTIAM